MSQSIDQRIVEMKFDNAQFEKSVRQTISSLEQLEEALNFEDAEKGFKNIENAATEVDLSHLEESVDKISDKFSAFGILGVQVMERLSNKFIDLGVSVAKSLSVDQLGAGWGKYESLMEASQVMVNNIKKEGETAEDVMPRVQEQINNILEYTDATSYSFDQLITTLGKFTSAGVELEDAVVMVEGIANWSATAGISAQRAAPMFYNLAQAMASGALKAQDWKSLELLSAQTPDFLNKAIEMGLAYGTIEDAGNGFYRAGKFLFNASEGFRDSLSTGWFSKDVLGATLTAYGDTAEEFGQKAYDAAYQAKTFTDAVNAAKDAVSTGWTKTFQAVFGNYIEAAEFFTNIADYLIDIFNSGEELRNDAFAMWKDSGGREQLIDSLYKIFEIIIAIKDTIHEAIFNVINPARNLAENDIGYMDDATFIAKTLLQITNGIATAVQSIHEWFIGIYDVAEPLVEAVEEVYSGTDRMFHTIIDPAGTIISYTTAIETSTRQVGHVFEDEGHVMQSYMTTVTDTVKSTDAAFVDMRVAGTSAIKQVDKALADSLFKTFPDELKELAKNGTKVDYKRTSSWIHSDEWWDYQEAITGVDQSMNKALSHAYSGFGDYQKKALQMIESGQAKLEDIDTSKWTADHVKDWKAYWKVRNSTEYKAVEELEKSTALTADEKLANEIYESFPKEIKEIIKNGYEVDYKRTSGWRNEDKWWDYQQALTGIDQTDNKLLSHAYGEFGYYQKKALEMVENGTITKDQVDTTKWTKAHIKAWEEYWAVRDRQEESAKAAAEAAEQENQLGENTVFTAGRLANLQRILQGIISVFNIAKRVISGVVKGVGKLLLKLTPLLDIFINIGAFLGDILYNIDQMGQLVENVVGQAFESLGGLVQPVIQSIADWFKNTFGDFSTPEARAERLQELVEKVSKAYNWLNDNVRPVIESVTTWFSDQFNAVKTWFEGTTLYQALSNFFGAEEIEEVGDDGQKTLKTVTFLDRLWLSVSDVLTKVQTEFEKFEGTSFYQTLSNIFSTKKLGRPEDGDERYETFFDRLVAAVTEGWANFQATDFYKFFVEAGNTISNIFNDIFGDTVVIDENGEEKTVTFFDRLVASVTEGWASFQETDFYKFFVNAGNTIGSFFNDIFGEKIVIDENGEEKTTTFFDRLSESVTNGIATIRNVFEVEIPSLIATIKKSINDVWDAIVGIFVSDEELATANQALGMSSAMMMPLTKNDIFNQKIKTGLSGIGSFISNFFGDMTNPDKQNTIFSGIVSTFNDTISSLASEWEKFQKTAVYTWLESIYKSVSGWISTFIGDMTDPGNRATLFSGVVDTISGLFVKLSDAWDTFVKSPFFEWVKTTGASIGQWLSDTFGTKIVGKTGRPEDGDEAYVYETFFDRLINGFVNFKTKLENLVTEIQKSPAYTFIKSYISPMIDNLKNVFGNKPLYDEKGFALLDENGVQKVETFWDRVNKVFGAINGIWTEIQKSPIYIALKNAKDSIATMISNFIGDMNDPVKRAEKFSSLSSFFQPVVDIVNGLFGTVEEQTNIQENIDKPKQGFNLMDLFIGRAMADEIDEASDQANKQVQPLLIKVEKNSFWKNIGILIGNLIKGVVNGVKDIKEGIKEASGLDIEAVISKVVGWIYKVIAAVFIIKGLWAMLNFVQHFNQRARSAFDSIASVILGLAAAIGVLVLAVTIFSKIPAAQMQQGMWYVGVLLLGLALMIAGVFAGASLLAKSANKDPKTLASISKTITAMANVIRAIGVSMLMLSVSLLILGKMKPEELLRGYTYFRDLFWIIFLITGVFTAFASWDGGNTNLNPREAGKTIKSIALMMLSFGAAILMLTVSILMFKDMDTKTFLSAGWKVGVILLAVMGVAMALIKVASKSGTIKKDEKLPKELAALSAILISIGAVVLIMVASIMLLSNAINTDGIAVAGAFVAIVAILVVVTACATQIIKASSNLKEKNNKQIAAVTGTLLMIAMIVAALVAGMVVLAHENISWADMAAYFIGISAVLLVMVHVVKVLNDANLGVGAIKGAAILTAALSIILLGLALVAKLASSAVKSAAEDVSSIIRRVSSAIGSSKNMLNGATADDFKPVADILKLFADFASQNFTTNFSVLETASSNISTVCTNINTAYGMIPSEGFKSSFDEVLSVMDAFKTKATEYKDASFDTIGNVTWYIEQAAAGIKTAGNLFLDAQKDIGAISWGIETIGSLVSIGTNAQNIRDLGALPSVMAELGAAISIFFGAINDENGVIDTSGKVDIANIASIFTQLKDAMPDNTLIGEIQSYAEGGDNDMVKFGLGIVAIGSAMQQYQEKVKDIDSAKLEPAQTALAFFQQLNSDLRGGNVQQATDEASLLNGTLTGFANDISILGTNLSGYYEEVKAFDKTKFAPAQDMLDFFRILKNKLEGMDENGHAIGDFIVDSGLPDTPTLQSFGTQIKELGSSINSYYGSVKDLKWNDVHDSLKMLDFFNGLQSRLPRMNNVFSFFSGKKQTLEEFGSDIEIVGHDVRSFVDSVVGMTEGSEQQGLNLLDENVRASMTTVIDILSAFADMQEKVGAKYSGLRLRDMFWDIGIAFDSNHLGKLTENEYAGLKQFASFGNVVSDPNLKSGFDSCVSFINGFVGMQAQLTTDPTMGFIQLDRFLGYLVDTTKYLEKDGGLQNFINKASAIDVKDTTNLVNLLTAWANLEGTLSKNYVDGYLPDMSEEMVSVLQTIGFDITKEISSGMEDTESKGLIGASMVSLKDAAYSKGSETDYMNSLEPIGKYLVEGLAKGITDNAHLVSAAVESLSSDYVVTVAKKTLDENSPSKVFYGLGMYVDKGLAMGIDDYANVVAVSTSDVSQEALDKAKTILADISAGLTDDVSSTPTITPVIDASQISSGMSSINSLFGNRTIGVDTERVRGLFSSSEKAETAVYNDSNVIQAIGDINERLNTLNENIAAMQIVLDTGVLTGALAPKIDRYLGRQARRN